jgi:hypothetical protein
LGILSANPLIASIGVYHYNFATSSSQIYGGLSGAKEIVPGIWGMVAGDGNSDGVIDLSDIDNVWRNQSGNTGYLKGDFDMNGNADNRDKNDNWIINLNRSSQVPE